MIIDGIDDSVLIITTLMSLVGVAAIFYLNSMNGLSMEHLLSSSRASTSTTTTTSSTSTASTFTTTSSTSSLSSTQPLASPSSSNQEPSRNSANIAEQRQ
eukprot:Awhi_evm1s13941